MSNDQTAADTRDPAVGHGVDSDLDVVAPEPRVVCGFSVGPVRIGNLPAFMRALRRIDFDLDAAEIDVFALVEKNGEAMIDAVASGLGVNRPDIAALGTEDFAELAVTVLEVNADFFAQRLSAQIPNWMERLSSTLGLNLFVSSSAPGTATPT